MELLDAGVDVSAVNDDKAAPLSLAAHHGHEDVVVVLLDAGVRVDARVFFFMSFLFLSSTCECKRVVRCDDGRNGIVMRPTPHTRVDISLALGESYELPSLREDHRQESFDAILHA